MLVAATPILLLIGVALFGSDLCWTGGWGTYTPLGVIPAALDGLLGDSSETACVVAFTAAGILAALGWRLRSPIMIGVGAISTILSVPYILELVLMVDLDATWAMVLMVAPVTGTIIALTNQMSTSGKNQR